MKHLLKEALANKRMGMAHKYSEGGDVQSYAESHPNEQSHTFKSPFVSGGKVDGHALHKGDDERNDIVDAKLSPGEVVLPRSVTKSKHPIENSAKFVHNELYKHKKDHMASGGIVKDKMSKTMNEFKSGTLHSGSKKGPEVTNPKQAIAIGLSEARAHGASIPPKGMYQGGEVTESRHRLAQKMSDGGKVITAEEAARRKQDVSSSFGGLRKYTPASEESAPSPQSKTNEESPYKALSDFSWKKKGVEPKSER